MTLILGELSFFGIAMAADSTVTVTNQLTGMRHVNINAARKLQSVPYLNAGVSCWGLGDISGIPTDDWLSDFISHNIRLQTLQSFAEELATQLNASVNDPRLGTGIAGFHLAGFESYNGIPTPSFYHIHDGESKVLQNRGTTININQFNANHDMPPDIFQRDFGNGGWYLTRNGDFQIYAQIFDSLHAYFGSLSTRGIVIPNSQSLDERADYLVFQIRTISEIYRFSNLIPGIGGDIHYLIINPNGIQSQGIR